MMAQTTLATQLQEKTRKAASAYTPKELKSMDADDLVEVYRDAIQIESSYVGGDGLIELQHWGLISKIEAIARKQKIQLPDRDAIEITAPDWM